MSADLVESGSPPANEGELEYEPARGSAVTISKIAVIRPIESLLGTGYGAV